MHVTVTSSDATPTGPIVEFTCRYGAGRGVWAVGVPEPGREYDVELDLRRPLRFDVDAKTTDEETPRILALKDRVVLVASVEDVFDDQTASLRIGDSLLLVECEGTCPAVGSWVEVSIRRLELYDTGT
ncbi:MAG: hypothetical protein BGO49_10500 [Planctomycetales bacterium 71-10]|nr:MAG: hypothetical protein BGO49_10500 [Planctomycetales bacterium 71-10]